MSSSSNWPIWDFFENDISLKEHRKGLCLVNCKDAFIEKMLLNFIPKEKFTDSRLHPLIGGELTETMIDEKLFSLDFFSENLSYYILLADEINIATANYLLRKLDSIEDQSLFLFFRKKTSPAWKLFSKNKNIKKIEIKSINFWEGTKLINFLMSYLKTPLPYDISQYLVQVLPLEVSEYIKYLKLIKTNLSSSSDLSLENIKELILEERVDNFLFSEALGKKDFKKFYALLSQKEYSFDSLKALFVFLQSHLMKLMDTSYCSKKNRLSNYDKEILVHSKLWNKKELLEMIIFMQEYELMAKQQNSMIYIEFNKKYLSFL